MTLSVVGAGGGGGLPPGMTPDPFSPGGYVLAGGLTALGGMAAADGTPNTPVAGTYDTIDTDGNEANISPGSVALTRVTSQTSVYIQQADAQTHPPILVYGSGFARRFLLAASGDLGLGGGIGLFAQDAPTSQAVLATGAGHAVDDVIALLQSYGLCKQS